MAKLPTQRTRLPGIERFDVELNAFLRSCDMLVFYYGLPRGLWFFREGGTRPEKIANEPGFKAALRLALIDPDTNTEPNRQKLDDGLTALSARNDLAIRQRLQAYEAAHEAEWEAERAARKGQVQYGGPDEI